jgi:hypothetical protein
LAKIKIRRMCDHHEIWYINLNPSEDIPEKKPDRILLTGNNPYDSLNGELL